MDNILQFDPKAVPAGRHLLGVIALATGILGEPAGARENFSAPLPAISSDTIEYGAMTIGEGKYLLGEEVSGPATFCSDAQWVCMKGDLINLVLPRNCEVTKEQGPWSVNGVVTNILYRKAELPGLHGGGSGTTLYLGNPLAPNIAYEYDPLIGVTYIFWDRDRKLDFVSLATNGEIDKWKMNWFADPKKKGMVFQKEPGKYLGRCI